MKIVFMGTPQFAVPSLLAITKAGHEVTCVVTNPDEPQGRGLKLLPPAVKVAAFEMGLPVIQVSNLKDEEFKAALGQLAADVFVVVAFRILPREIFTIPKLGTFNLHASLLPRYRGAAPINWAIINGETETGATTFFLDEKIDTGKIILQRKTVIGENETAGELSARLSLLGAEAVIETLRLIESGNIQPIEQDDTIASKAPKISKEDSRINWSRTSRETHNLIRGFSPEPGAFSFLQGKLVKIFLSRMTGRQWNGSAGELVIDAGRLYTMCSDDLLEIVELQLEGKRRLAAQEFLRGARIAAGTRFESLDR